MLLDKTDTGDPRDTVFGGFQDQPDRDYDFNPLQARFMKYLQYAINNVRKGKVPRLANRGQWPPGTMSIGQGRRKEGDRPSAGQQTSAGQSSGFRSVSRPTLTYLPTK